jgi:hypothetical protein
MPNGDLLQENLDPGKMVFAFALFLAFQLKPAFKRCLSGRFIFVGDMAV